MRDIRVFLGHQFVSKTTSKTKLRYAFIQAVEAAGKDWNAVEVQQIRVIPSELRIDSGQGLFENVIAEIDRSDICVFDLTEKNHNVIFELGHAFGRNKQVIWVCNENLPLNELPSDFQGQFILKYSESNNLQVNLESEIRKRINDVIGAGDAKSFLEIWDLNQATAVNIVVGRIPIGEQGNYTDINKPNYLRYQSVADIDTLIYLGKFLSNRFPSLKQEDHTPSEFRGDMDRPLLLLGGPALNSLAARYYGTGDDVVNARLPVSFTSDDKGEEFLMVINQNGSKLELRHHNNGKEVLDYGIFARFLDDQSGAPVFAIGGLQTVGVLGAAKAFCDNYHGPKNCSEIIHRTNGSQSFVVIFQVCCRITDFRLDVETPKLSNTNIVYLGRLP